MNRWIGIALAMVALVGCGGAGEPRESTEYQDPGFQPTERWVATEEDDTVNVEQGKCLAWSTIIDVLTDEEAHILSCTHTLLGIRVADVVLQWNDDGSTGVIFWIKSMLHFEPLIPVAFRIDKGEVRREQWLWSGENNYAFTPDRDAFDTLLAELPAAKRLAIQVGSEQAVIFLDGSAAAVEDFRSRIAQPE